MSLLLLWHVLLTKDPSEWLKFDYICINVLNKTSGQIWNQKSQTNYNLERRKYFKLIRFSFQKFWQSDLKHNLNLGSHMDMVAGDFKWGWKTELGCRRRCRCPVRHHRVRGSSHFALAASLGERPTHWLRLGQGALSPEVVGWGAGG